MAEDDLSTTIIGELYDPRRTHWPEGSDWRLSTRRVELLVVLRHPGPRWIDAVHGHAGPARFAVIEADHVLLLAFRFGDQMRWNDQPWQTVRQRRQYPDYPIGLPEVEPGHHLLIVIRLVDAATGILRAQGIVTWPYHFVDQLRRAIDRHLATGNDDAAAGRELDALYARYPDTARMVRERALATCTGGKQE